MNKDQKNTAAIIGGVAALAAGIAGAVFLYGTKEGTKRRKQIKGWMLRLKGEVLDQMENLQDVSETTYNEIVDKVAAGYKGVSNIDPVELGALIADLKSHWKTIHRALTAPSKAKKTKTTKKR